MQGFHLNGWQRIGIVLSVLWVLVSAVWAAHDVHSTMQGVDALYFKCIFRPGANADTCKAMADTLREGTSEYFWSGLFWFVLAPVPIVWIIVSGLISLVRWIRHRFQPSA